MKHTTQAAALALAAFGATAACAQGADETWRPLDPQNTIVMEIRKTATSTADLLERPEPQIVVIELAPEFAPNHVARIKALSRTGFYDGRVFHRVIEDFMAQGGGTPGDPTGGDSGLPDLQSEFTARLGPTEPIVKVQDARVLDPRGYNSPRTEAGFLNGFPVAYQPAAQATISNDGKRDVWLLHCPGAVAAARTSNPDSANFQFYITRGEPAWLDSQYTVWGRVRYGQEAVDAIKNGEPVVRPDAIARMRLLADLPEAERPQVEVMRTDSEAFAQVVAEAKAAAGDGVDINVCDITVPSRMAE